MGPRSRQSGLTMIEVAIALALGLMIIGGVVSIYSGANDRREVTQVETQIRLIRRDVRQIWSDEADYSAITEATAIDMGAVPQTMIRPGNEIRHTWGGRVYLAPDGGNPQRLDIDLREVPASACVQLATFTEGDWAEVTVNGTVVDGSPDDARPSCTDGPTNRVIFETR